MQPHNSNQVTGAHLRASIYMMWSRRLWWKYTPLKSRRRGLSNRNNHEGQGCVMEKRVLDFSNRQWDKVRRTYIIPPSDKQIWLCSFRRASLLKDSKSPIGAGVFKYQYQSLLGTYELQMQGSDRTDRRRTWFWKRCSIRKFGWDNQSWMSWRPLNS